jgi:diacylglycerol kinase (ATP)
MDPVEILIVTNPTAGRGKARILAEDVKARLRAEGRKAEVALTQGAGDAGRLAAEALAAGAFVVAGCGGDGTLQEIANVLAGTPCAMGFLPVGRCNDLARALGIVSTDSPEKLARNLLSPTPRKIDLGVYGPLAGGSGVQKRYFCTVATLGFDSDVSRFVETRKLPVKGTLAYLYGIVRVLLAYRCPRVRLRGDFGEWEGRILLAATGNTPFYGGAMQIAPGARLDDGLFHVCVVREVPRRTVLRILPQVFKGQHIHHPAVQLLQTKRLEIETQDSSEWICADGESLGQTPALLENAAQVLHVRAASSC